jgi:hypothetical protein
MRPESINPHITTAQRAARENREKGYGLLYGQLEAIKSDPVQVEAFSDWVDEQTADAAHQADKFVLEAAKRKPDRSNGIVHVVFTHAQNLVDRQLAQKRKAVRATKKLKEAASKRIRNNSSGDYHFAMHEFHDQYGSMPDKLDKGALLPLDVEEVKLWVEPNKKRSWMLDPQTHRSIQVLAQLRMAKRLGDMRDNLQKPQI